MKRVCLGLMIAGTLSANPENPVVVSGDVSVSVSGQLLEVTASNRAVVEWERFLIGVGETVRFVQPSSGATVLNRVTGTDVSVLSGVLQSNGTVYLINPRGVIVGAGAVIDTAGFLATTLDVENGEFLGGGDVLFTGDSEATVVQQGTIRARDGNIVLMAHSVRHEGKLVADNGSVALVAGHEVLLKPEGMPLLTIRPDLRALGVENLGSIEALNAYVLSDGVSKLGALRQEGDISLTQEGGKLVLSSHAHGATIGQKATLTAPNGTISVSAEEDIMFNLGTLNASGTGGGTINITAPVFINTGTLRANGSGGTISVEAEDAFVETVFGHLSAGTISVSAPSVFSSGKHEAPDGHVHLTGDTITLIAEEISHDFGAGATTFPTIALVDPLAASGGTGTFGQAVAVLSNGNIVVTKPGDDTGQTNRGAVFLYSGTTGALISTLVGTSASDAVGSGGISTLMGNANYLIRSPAWTNTNTAAASAGAVTWASGSSGISGSVDATNSLVGTSASDAVGIPTALSNGNYVVRSPGWMGGSTNGIGAATWGNGTTGIVGTVSGVNSLLGSVATDRVSSGGVSGLLVNGNYVVSSPGWMGGATNGIGAATWGNGSTGTTGTVSIANSLIGSTTTDLVSNAAPTPLNNGNYVVRSPNWMGGATNGIGAATWGNGTTGITGTVSTTNSLVGSNAADQVSSTSVVALSNNHYVVASPTWMGGSVAGFGAATWGNGTTGTTGTVSDANSLVGSAGASIVSNGSLVALTNGNYVVRSPNWDSPTPTINVGAATWGDGSMGITGTVSVANSLIGSTLIDQVGLVVNALTNGHYVVASSQWNNPGTAGLVGAVTWGNGTTGITGTVSSVNSLLGSMSNDQVGLGLTSLTNGNYVIRSNMWMSNKGAATWGDGSMSTTGTVSVANSLVGSATGNTVSSSGFVALTNGNYVVLSPSWSGAVATIGAATWGNGSTGITGTVSAANSLVGSTTLDSVSNLGATRQSTGDYIVISSSWDQGAMANVGAATWGNGSTGITGTITAQNSVIGTMANSGLTIPLFDNPAVAGSFIPQTFVVKFASIPAVLIAGDPVIPSPPAPPPTPSAAVIAAAQVQLSQTLSQSFVTSTTDPSTPIYTGSGLFMGIPSLVLVNPLEPHPLLQEAPQ